MVKKEIKEKLPKKVCFLCGIETNDHLIFQNGAVCKACQKSEKFLKLKEELK